MTEIQNPKQKKQSLWNGLEFEIYLEFGAWDLWFKTLNSKADPGNSDSRNAGQAWPIEDPVMRGRTRRFWTK